VTNASAATSRSPPTCTRWDWPGACCTCGPRQQFFADADAGTLPSVSIVDPDFGAYSEENPQDIAKGESFAAEVINGSCTARPGRTRCCSGPTTSTAATTITCRRPRPWRRTTCPRGTGSSSLPSWLRRLLRPVFGKAFADLENIDAGPSDYTRYGFRVPAVVVSPYARPGYVCTTTFDHTSILKLIEQKWNLPR
jgi:phospholipase C